MCWSAVTFRKNERTTWRPMLDTISAKIGDHLYRTFFAMAMSWEQLT